MDPINIRDQRQDLYSHIRKSKGAPRDINHLKKLSHFLHPHLYSDMSPEKESPYKVRSPTHLTNNDDFTFYYQLIELFLQTFMSQYSPQGKHILL